MVQTYEYVTENEETCENCGTKFKTKTHWDSGGDAFLGYSGRCPKCKWEPGYG